MSFFGKLGNSEISKWKREEQKKSAKLVVISDRAYISVLSETQLNIKTETGGVFLGHRCGSIWYVIEAIDPGPNSVFSASFFEYDRPYINHLINRVKELYQEPLDLIGLWHRHPGSMDYFSHIDEQTNTDYARLNKSGSISALVNIDPDFRITMYAVTLPLQYTKIKIELGNKEIPKNLLAYYDSAEILEQINNYDASQRYQKAAGGLKSLQARKKESETKNTSFTQTMSYFLGQKNNPVEILEKVFEIKKNEIDVEFILEVLENDLGYLQEHQIGYCLEINDEEQICLREENPNVINPITLCFYNQGKDVFFTCEERAFRYQENLFEKIYKVFPC
jgi:proteasome lid subunit RPN8/RPN11